MIQPALLDDMADLEFINWRSYAVSASHDERQIIEWIMLLHNHGRPFDLDPTYSTGRFWTGLPQPAFKCDIMPQAPGVQEADARNLPYADESMESIMFDPPFVVAPSPAPGIIRDRFSCYKNVAELWQFYRDALCEFWRILRPDGIVAFKCQDMVSGSVNYMTHAAVMVMAQELGYYVKDLFLIVRDHVLFSPNMKNQQHARKKHSYFVVLQKASNPKLLAASRLLP